METGYIRFTEMNAIEVKLVDGTVWMTANEIADLFGENVPMINKNLKEIFKDNLLIENEVIKEYRYTCPKHGVCIRIYYSLGLITFLSFKMQSFYTKLLREWVFRSIHEQDKKDNIYNAFVMCDLRAKEHSQFSLN